MKCPKCGKENDINDKYCGYCGAELKVTERSTNKNKMIIAVLVGVIVVLLVVIIFITKSSNNDDIDDSTTISEETSNEDDTIESSTATQYDLIDVTASSALHSDDDISYSITNITDNDSSTAWVEGVDGDGIGEYVEFDYTGPVYLSSITIANGYRKSEDIYYKNNRVKDLRIVLDDGTYKVITLNDDYYDSVETFDLDLDVSSKSFKIYIESVYSGNKYDDTCIDEISIDIK